MPVELKFICACGKDHCKGEYLEYFQTRTGAIEFLYKFLMICNDPQNLYWTMVDSMPENWDEIKRKRIEANRQEFIEARLKEVNPERIECVNQ